MSGMPTSSTTMTELMAVAMMVAMMLPSIAPTLWRYHHQLRAAGNPDATRQTAIFAAGYAGVWVAIALALLAVSDGISSLQSWVVAMIVLCAGAVQCSRWKANQLDRCRRFCSSTSAVPATLRTALCNGVRLGVDCGSSCAAPMAALLAIGLMDTRMMATITAAITAERVSRRGVRIARSTGVVAIVVGLVLCCRAFVAR